MRIDQAALALSILSLAVSIGGYIVVHSERPKAQMEENRKLGELMRRCAESQRGLKPGDVVTIDKKIDTIDTLKSEAPHYRPGK